MKIKCFFTLIFSSKLVDYKIVILALMSNDATVNRERLIFRQKIPKYSLISFFILLCIKNFTLNFISQASSEVLREEEVFLFNLISKGRNLEIYSRLNTKKFVKLVFIATWFILSVKIFIFRQFWTLRLFIKLFWFSLQWILTI